MVFYRTQLVICLIPAFAASAIGQQPAPQPSPSTPPNGAVVMSAALPAATPSGPPPATVPQLDVISVKADKGGGGIMRMGPTADGLNATNIPVHLMLTQGFHMNDDQILNEPAWGKTDRFDVEAKVTGEDAAVVPRMTQDQKREFFQQVLKERFGLVVRHETRELPEYALVVAKGGPRLKESKPESAEDSKPDAQGPPGPVPSLSRMRGPGFGMSMGPGGSKLNANSQGIAPLVQILSNVTGRTVVDKTGLTGKYDFTMTWSSGGVGPAGPLGLGGGAGPPPGDAAGADAGPDLFTAIQEQLGLKLEPTKGPVDVIVIDHLEKPAEN